jgi:hypothetical protein
VPLVKLADKEGAALLSLPNLLAVDHQPVRNIRPVAGTYQFVTRWKIASDTRWPLCAL